MVWADGGAAAEPEAVAELGLELGLGLTLSTCDQEGQKDAVCPTGVWTAGRVRTQKRLSRGPFSVGRSWASVSSPAVGNGVDLFARGPREELALGSQCHWTTVGQLSTAERSSRWAQPGRGAVTVRLSAPPSTW